MMPAMKHQYSPLTISFIGPNNLLIIKRDNCAVVVNKQPARYINSLAASNRHLVENPLDGPTPPAFVAKEFVLVGGEKSALFLNARHDKYWIVLAGLGWITVGDTTRLVSKQLAILIPSMQVHRIHNSSSDPLRLVEISSSERLTGDEHIEFIDNNVAPL